MIPSNNISTFCKGGVQWKQGVVICMVLYTSLLYDTTPIHCTPLRLHPPPLSIQEECFLHSNDNNIRVIPSNNIRVIPRSNIIVIPSNNIGHLRGRHNYIYYDIQ